MGVSIECKKGSGIDMGYGGFFNLRDKIASLIDDEFEKKYREIANHYSLTEEEYEKKCSDFDKDIENLIKTGKVSVKVIDFLLQEDSSGSIRYGACKEILKLIGDYDDEIVYGYAGRKNPAKFKDFKFLLEDCVNKKCDLVWR